MKTDALGKQRENTPDSGGVGATCRRNWTQVLFSLHWLPGWLVPSLLSTLKLPSLFPAGLPLSQTYVMSTCPWGPFGTEFHILCNTYCLAWDEQTRNSGRKGTYSAWRGEGAGSGIFQDLLGLCWHPVRLCYQLQLAIRGYSRGILGCGWGGIDLALKYTSKMCIWFALSLQGCYSFMVYIRIFFISLWNMFFFPNKMSVWVTVVVFSVIVLCRFWCN